MLQDKNICVSLQSQLNMVPIVQLVRASDCGSECRGFESHWAPKEQLRKRLLFLCTVVNRTHGFVIDEVAELQRRTPLYKKGSLSTSFFV